MPQASRGPSLQPSGAFYRLLIMAGKAREQDRQQAVLHTVVGRLVENKSAFRAFLRRKLGDDALVDDLLQQSLMRAIEKHHTLNEHESAVGWFYRILRHAIADYYRSQGAESRKNAAFLQTLTRAGEDKVAPPDTLRPTVCACLHDLLQHVRPAYADLIRRIDLGGESPKKVAQDLKLTANNLTVRLHRARQALRARLEDACGLCSKHGCLNCTCSDR